jgi:hypothetical protein
MVDQADRAERDPLIRLIYEDDLSVYLEGSEQTTSFYVKSTIKSRDIARITGHWFDFSVFHMLAYSAKRSLKTGLLYSCVSVRQLHREMQIPSKKDSPSKAKIERSLERLKSHGFITLKMYSKNEPLYIIHPRGGVHKFGSDEDLVKKIKTLEKEFEEEKARCPHYEDTSFEDTLPQNEDTNPKNEDTPLLDDTNGTNLTTTTPITEIPKVCSGGLSLSFDQKDLYECETLPLSLEGAELLIRDHAGSLDVLNASLSTLDRNKELADHGRLKPIINPYRYLLSIIPGKKEEMALTKPRRTQKEEPPEEEHESHPVTQETKTLTSWIPRAVKATGQFPNDSELSWAKEYISNHGSEPAIEDLIQFRERRTA